jgi:hypothetical protein
MSEIFYFSITHLLTLEEWFWSENDFCRGISQIYTSSHAVMKNHTPNCNDVVYVALLDLPIAY